MVLSRALRERLAVNASAISHGEFAALLLAALKDPEMRQAIAEAVMLAQRRTQPRSSRPPVTTTAAARDLKAARLAARGRNG